jgi:glutathione S-transferase
MFAPVASRFQTYDVDLDRIEAAYARAILATPTVRGWIEDAHKEPWSIAEFDQA